MLDRIGPTTQRFLTFIGPAPYMLIGGGAGLAITVAFIVNTPQFQQAQQAATEAVATVVANSGEAIGNVGEAISDTRTDVRESIGTIAQVSLPPLIPTL